MARLIKRTILIPACLLIMSAAAPFSAQGADEALSNDILQIARAWAHIKFEEHNSERQQKEISTLAKSAAALESEYPGRPEPIIWEGVLLSEGASMASDANSIFTARSLAYRARDVLLKAEKIDPAALEAGAPTSLGVLYYRVPSFPLAFGDKQKARNYLEEAVRLAPDGLDANYFYGDFLMQEHDYPRAVRVWKHALTIAVHADRPVWDQSRRIVIQQELAKIASAAQ